MEKKKHIAYGTFAVVLLLLAVGEVYLFTKPPATIEQIPTIAPIATPTPAATPPVAYAVSPEWHEVLAIKNSVDYTSQIFEIESAQVRLEWDGAVAGVSKMATASERWYCDRWLEIISISIYFENGTWYKGCSSLSEAGKHSFDYTFPANDRYYLTVTVKHLAGDYDVKISNYY